MTKTSHLKPVRRKTEENRWPTEHISWGNFIQLLQLAAHQQVEAVHGTAGHVRDAG